MKKLALISVVIGVALAGCGGSSDNSSKNENSNSGNSTVMPDTSIGSVGAVDVQQNTIVVNGNTYGVSKVVYGPVELGLANLQPNMTVRVDSKSTALRSASASSAADTVVVTLEPTITGRITAVDHTKKTFSVNGFPLEFADLNSDIELNDWVVVSSRPTADAGYTVLSVVEIDVDKDYPSLGDYYEMEGLISSIDANASTFQLGADITVSYAKLDNLKVGQWVEVEGKLEGDIFIASEVEIDNYEELQGESEIEGIVTWVANDYSEFSLNYRGAFIVNDTTRFEDGVKTDLKMGREVEVTSAVVDGKRVVTEVEFDDDDNSSDWGGKEFECEGVVSNYDMNARTFQVARCEDDDDKEMTNNTVVIDAQTRFEDIDELNLNGAKVEVEGVIINEQNIARKIEIDND